MDTLTQRQGEILAFIRQEARANGLPPTVREVANRFGFRSPKGAADHVDALVRKGYLERIPGAARGLRVLHADDPDYPEPGIPIVGDVAAGLPILAVENVLGVLSLDTAFGRGELFAVRVRGDSMVDYGIFEGDHVIVRRSPTLEVSAIAVVYLEGEATVKKVVKTAGGYDLVPGNSRYPVQHITRDTPGFAMAGPVVGVVRAL
ncbi:MAG TPA: transcriptional repressor LexA [Kiritimatiellia bacterium]|nr:transcriptional repressor LexA [Kiritimatiellia bacterium]HMO98527.1 transcriptional repressor LexA [Kiritimatiellia bacterium]